MCRLRTIMNEQKRVPLGAALLMAPGLAMADATVIPRRTHVQCGNMIYSKQFNGTLNFETWKFEHDAVAGACARSSGCKA